MYTLIIAYILAGGALESRTLGAYETTEECIEARDITRQEFDYPGLIIVCVDDHNNGVELDEPMDGGML